MAISEVCFGLSPPSTSNSINLLPPTAPYPVASDNFLLSNNSSEVQKSCGNYGDALFWVSFKGLALGLLVGRVTRKLEPRSNESPVCPAPYMGEEAFTACFALS